MSTQPPADQTYFQSQRAILVAEISQSMDSVLTNLNRLNRSLESIVAVGNEFSSVEALWSTFEGVMGSQPPRGQEQRANGGDERDDGEEDGMSATGAAER